MKATLNTAYWEGTGDVSKHEYADGSLALAFTVDGEPYGALSVNLIASVGRAPEGHIYVKNEGEHTGIVDALVAAGVAENTGVVVEYGNFGTTATLMKVLI